MSQERAQTTSPSTSDQSNDQRSDQSSDQIVDDVVVVGEALVDIVVIPDQDPVEHPGGSPANVALGLGRLGRRVSLLTRLADDERGRSIMSHLRDSEVTVIPESVSAQATSTAMAHVDQHGVAEYDFDIDWELPSDLPSELTDPEAQPPARALHVGSIATVLMPGADSVLALVEAARDRMTVSYDPNARPRLMGEAKQACAQIERFVAASDVVKVSDEDLAWLCPDQTPDEVAQRWLSMGPAVVVVTLGGEGAIAHSAAGRAVVPGQQITVVDTVGAGDSFFSALLDHLAGADLLGGDRLPALRAIGIAEMEAMLRHAIRVSAITCQRPGADPPRHTEL